MPSDFYRHLRRDLVRCIFDQLVAGDVLSGSGLIFLGRALRTLDSSPGCDWQASFWLGRARESLAMAAERDGRTVDLIDQLDAALAACEPRSHTARPVCDER